MGMVLGLISIDDESIEKVLADPPLIWKVVAPDDPEFYLSERRGQKSSWFARLFGKGRNAASEEKEDEPIEPVEDIDLDKSWHGIHYLLTKTAWEGDPPLNFIVAGGDEVGKIEVGYGTARAFRSDAVLEIHNTLSEISSDELKRRYDPLEMTKLDIYPSIWDRHAEEDDLFGYCSEYFDDLKAFLARTAERRLGMVVYLT